MSFLNYRLLSLFFLSQVSLFLQSCSLAPEAEFSYSIVRGKKEIKDKKVVSDTGGSAFVPKEAFDTEAKIEVNASNKERLVSVQTLTKDTIISSASIQTKNASAQELNDPKADIQVCLPISAKADLSQIIVYESSNADKKINQVAASKLSKEADTVCVKTKVTNGEIFIAKPSELKSSVTQERVTVKSFKFFDSVLDTEKTDFEAGIKTHVILKALGEKDGVLTAAEGIVTLSFLGPMAIDKQNFVFEPSDRGQKSIDFLFAAPGNYEVSFEYYDLKTSITLRVSGKSDDISAASSGNETPSDPIPIVKTEPLPAEPYDLSLMALSMSQIQVQWRSGGGSTSDFQLAYQQGSNLPADCNQGTVISKSAISGTSYVLSGLTRETVYAVRVCSLNSNHTPDLSAGITGTGATLGDVAPFDPAGLVLTSDSDTQVSLSWNSGGGSTSGYRIAYQSGATAPANCATGTTIAESAIAGTSKVITGLTANTQYSFRVCSINSNPTVDVSNGVTASTTTWVVAPNEPTGLTVSGNTTTQINLSWSSGGGTTSAFHIAYQTGATAPANCASGTTISDSLVGSATNYTVTGLVGTNQYSFRVCAINANQVPDVSSGITASGYTSPDQPTSPGASADSNVQITLSWSSGGGSTNGYRIAYQAGATAPADCATGSTIAESAITGTSKAIAGLSNATQYSFRICAINANATPNVSAGVTLTATTQAIPVITTLSDSVYPVDDISPPLIQGTSYTLASAADADGNSITMTCTYKSLDLNASDPNYAAAGTNCNTLSSLATANSTIYKSTVSIPSASASPSIVWRPTATQRGTFQFTFNAADSTGLSAVTKTLNVTVRENTNTTNLLSSVDALNAASATGLSISTPSAPNASSSTVSTMMNLVSTGADGALTFGTANPWSGTGATSSPYSLNFTAANSDHFSLSNILNGQTRFGLSTWIKPSAPTTASQVIASNGGGTGNGFVLRQSATPTGKAEFVVGQKYYSYQDIVLRDKPVGYWRLGETSGTTANDLSYNANNGTYTGGITLNQTGSLSGDSNPSALFSGGTSSTNNYVNLGDLSVADFGTSDFTLETWVKSSFTDTTNLYYFLNKRNNCNHSSFWNLNTTNAGLLQFEVDQDGAGTNYLVFTGTSNILNSNWQHLVVTRSGTSLKIYVNGALEGTGTTAGITNLSNTANFGIGGGNACIGGAVYSWNGYMDDTAIYHYALTQTQITEHYQTGVSGNYKSYPGNAILADLPTAYWPLNEKSDSTAYDLSGNGRDATYNSTYTLNQSGPFANDTSGSLYLAGSGFVSAPYVSGINSTSPFSAEIWAKVTGGAGTWRVPLSSRDQSNTAIGFNFYASAANDWQAWIGNGAWTVITGSAITLNSWTHLVMTYDGTKFKFYVNGILAGTSTTTYSSQNTFGIYLGRHVDNTSPYFFIGNLAQAATYNFALSQTQVTNHYNNGAWWFCQSQTSMNSSNWNQLSTLYDGTTAKLFINGQQECSVTPGTTYSSTVADTTFGNSSSGSNYWSGSMETMNLYGTSNGVTPISATNIQSDFTATANRIRTQPVEDVVTSNLVYSFDAANAKQGTQAYTNGCATSDLSAWDLSSSGFNATLKNFASCGASSGWIGNGTTGSPYAVALDGTNDYVNIPHNTNLNAFPITIGLWTRFTSAVDGAGILTKYVGSSYNGYSIHTKANGNICAWYIKDVSNLILDGACSTFAASGYNNGSWHYVAFVVDTTSGRLYVDGTLKGTLAWTGTAGAVTTTTDLNIGAYDAFLTGAVSTVQIYNAALTLQQIKQNCLAQEARFTSTPQSICAAP